MPDHSTLRIQTGPTDLQLGGPDVSDSMRGPMSCAACGQDWYRGWFSAPVLGGDDLFYHKHCVIECDPSIFVAARVMGVVDDDAD